MIISIPDKLTIDQSEKYILSIRLQPGGLSFSGYNPSVADSFFYRKIDFDRSNSYAASLKDCFFANEFFTWPYKKIQLVCVSSLYTLIPGELYKDNKKGDILSYNFFTPDVHVLTNYISLEDAQLIFGLNKEIYDFCVRSLIHPEFIHHLIPLMNVWQKQTKPSQPRQMFVILHEKLIDIICFREGKLLFANSFGFEDIRDLVYYILYVWQQTGMDQQTDHLQISGMTELQNSVLQVIREYIKHADPMEIPSEAYLQGGEILRAPIDLIALSVCE